jgi:hypothetical protein
MRSLRLDPALSERLETAARSRGETVSEFIRRAIADRADSTLENADGADFSDVIGSVHGGGGRARRTGRAFVAEISHGPRKK